VAREDLDAGALGTNAKLQLWKDTWAGGGWVHTVGEKGFLAARSPAGEWTVLGSGTYSGSYHSVGGPPDSPFAGAVFDSLEQTQLYTFSAGAGWTAAPALPLLRSVTAIHAPAPNEVFFGGSDSADQAGLVRAFR
jgi:hypothetical protein